MESEIRVKEIRVKLLASKTNIALEIWRASTVYELIASYGSTPHFLYWKDDDPRGKEHQSSFIEGYLLGKESLTIQLGKAGNLYANKSEQDKLRAFMLFYGNRLTLGGYIFPEVRGYDYFSLVRMENKSSLEIVDGLPVTVLRQNSH